MTDPNNTQNGFLLKLLDLQQDGKYAISAPTNWTTHTPLLEVSTEIDTIITELQDSLLRGETNDTAHWYFLVGSPGNGKSAAIGKLCRILSLNRGCRLYDEAGVAIVDLEPTSIPYAIDVYEGNNRFETVKIVQDASVVRNPFADDVDPSNDLLDTLVTAWERGISLVVCTNRGVLEKAHRDNHTNHEINRKPWFKIIKALVNATTPSGKIGNVCENPDGIVFKRVKIGYTHLDNRSLIRGERTFDLLVKNATNNEHWSCCKRCDFYKMCPFRANREWLADDEARRIFLQILTRAEVLSGQVIVFREALAIISLILAGCPRDYDNMHPCDWVKTKVDSSDIFALASRRIYMSLFSPYSPYGLDPIENLRVRQIENFKKLVDNIGDCSSQAFKSIKHLTEGSPPSTDVGVTRLLGENKTLANLDPSRDDLDTSFYERWDSEYENFPSDMAPYITNIETSCMLIWKEMEDCLEQTANYTVSNTYWALRRWSSNFMLHLGALKEGLSAWSKELDDFTSLLALMDKKEAERTTEDRRRKREIELKIENLLNTTKTIPGTKTVKLSENVTLSGQWVVEHLKPTATTTESSGSVSLAIKFKGGSRGGEKAMLAALMYLWLSRREKGNLEERCFPQELLVGISDARVRAASKGEYAFANDNVELCIKNSDTTNFRLIRFDGEVDVEP